jgi:hypothetical protein
MSSRTPEDTCTPDFEYHWSNVPYCSQITRMALNLAVVTQFSFRPLHVYDQ